MAGAGYRGRLKGMQDEAKKQPKHVVVRIGWRDLNYKFNLWLRLKLFYENCPAIKPTKCSCHARLKDQKSIMIINHFNLIILYDAPIAICSRTTQFTPQTYFMCYYHDFDRGGERIDGHLTKLLRSTLIYIFFLSTVDVGQRSIIIKPSRPPITF